MLGLGEALGHATQFEPGPNRPQCLTCGVRGFEAIQVHVNTTMHETVISVACNRCETREMITLYPTAEVKSIVEKTSWKRRKELEDTPEGLVQCICGVQQRSIKMVMIAHRTDDGGEYLLDRCGDCAKKKLCPSTPNGVHKEVLHVVFGDEEYADEWTFNPMPEKQAYGICKTCRANLYWAWTDGCSGEYREMTWVALADHWAAEARDRADGNVLAFSMDSTCHVNKADSWCDTHHGWHV
jgi:hypothetical protein